MGADELQRIELLLGESRSHRYSDPAQVVYFAELARAAADRLDASVHGSAAVADLRARVWVELGNAYRLGEDFSRAEQAFARALSWFDEGSGDPELLALIADRFATLLCHRRRFDESLALLDRLASFHLARGERHLAGRALITRGLYTENAGEPESAIRFTLRGLDLIEAEREPSLLLSGVHNLLWCASTLGRHVLLDRVIPKVRALYRDDDALNRLRLAWIEARVAFGLGRRDDATHTYEAVRSGFLEAGLVFPASLVALELALVYLAEGRPHQVITLSEELVRSFTALRVGREVIVSLLLLRRAVEQGEAREQLERRVTELVRAIRAFGR